MKTVTSLVLASFITAGLTACGSKSTIDLQTPPAAPAPEAPKNSKPLPGDPANPNDPSSNPEKPDQPVQTGPVAPRYRLVCDIQAQPSASFGFLETSAKSFDGSFIMFLGSYPNSTDPVSRDHSNIHVAANAVTVPGAQGDTLDMLFIAQKDYQGGYGPQRFYFVTVDTLMRTGNAVDLGAPADLSKSARQAADALGLTPANYGASDLGNFLLLPSKGGFKVVSHDRKRTFGTISADTSNTIAPKIYESKKVYSALAYTGGRFQVVIKKLNFTSSSVSVASTVSTGGSGTATPAQTYGNGSLIWSETAASSGAKSLTFAKVDLSTNRVTRNTYTTSQAGAKVYPQFAVINDNGNRTLHVAVESLTSVAPKDEDSTVKTVKVNYAAIETLTLDGNSLKDTDAIQYPAQAIARVEAQGLRGGTTIIKTLFTTENQDELIGTFDSFNGYQIYKDRGGFMDGVSQNNCLRPQVVEVNL